MTKACFRSASRPGARGIRRPGIPADKLAIFEKVHPRARQGILAEAAPSSDELIYSNRDNGFAQHCMRSPEPTRLYLRVSPEEDIENWPDDRIREELQIRLTQDGDSAHIVLPTGAKGMNQAASDVQVLAGALADFY